jgi:hypothetical protein
MEYKMTMPAEGAPATGDPATPPATGDGAGTQPTGQQQPGSETQTGDSTEGGTVSRTPAEEAAFWKTQSRKHEDRAKANNEAATKLRKLEDAQKSELQLATERAERAEAAAANSASERHRLLAAATHGLTPELVDFLGSGTEQEIFDRAEALNTQIDAAANARLNAELAKYGIQPGQAGAPGAGSAAAAASLAQGRRPVSQLRSGATPAPQAGGATDNNSAFRGMLGR